jgi:DNA invertase Pin-like site-specific DNA recombinase
VSSGGERGASGALCEHRHPCAGIAAARARGRKGGRRPKLSPEQQQLAADMARGGIPITTSATTLGCSRHTVYKALALVHAAVE